MAACHAGQGRRSSSAAPARTRWAFDGLRHAVLTLWCWFLPLQSSPQQIERARRVLAFCLAMSVWIPIFVAVYQFLGIPAGADILLIAALLLVAIPFVLRATRRARLCGNLLVALAFGTYTALALVTGGPAAAVTPWYVSLPIIAAFVAGMRWATVWTLLGVLTLCGLFAAREGGVDFPSPCTAAGLRFLQLAGLLGIVLCTAGLTFVFKALERRQRAALERALFAAQAADRAKSEFLANMSHEIRTPLTAILGYTELLREAARNPAEVERISHGEALATIYRNGEHLLQVINDILDLSKIEAGQLEVELGFFSPRQLVDDVLALFEAAASAKSLRLEACFDAELPDAVETDPTRLRQVLVNIVGNAVKFTERGAVHVAIRWRGPRTEPGSLEVAIRDSGIGMSGKELSRLFRPFSQADGSTSRRYGGTGLGLAICRRLVQMMGGSIEVTSEPEQGSCFTVSLPVARTRWHNADDATARRDDAAPHDAAISRGADHAWLAGCRILLAEDSADNQRLIRYVLQSAGAEVALADNGQSALELAMDELRQGSAFDLILMDMQMPVLDGYEATGRLRAAGYRSPIIALTAHALSTEHDKCRAAGCDDVCTKPIDRAAFFAALRRARTPATSARGCTIFQVHGTRNL